MSDKPMDTPFADFSREEMEAMSNTELMDRGIALDELGLDGWIDGIINMGVRSIGEMMVAMSMAAVEGRDLRQSSLDLHAAVGQVLHGVFDVGRSVGQREERGEL